MFFRVFYEAARNLDSQPPPRSDHVEASRPRGLCTAPSIAAPGRKWRMTQAGGLAGTMVAKPEYMGGFSTIVLRGQREREGRRPPPPPLRTPRTRITS